MIRHFLLIALLCSQTPAQSPLEKALAPLHEEYDPQERMLKTPLKSPGYHTKLTSGLVHPTRNALMYATACLATGDAALTRRACEVIDRVIDLQDQNPSSKTYGIWSWFLEEPLDKMSPPDWNWADFNGRALLQVRLRYWNKIPDDLKKKIDASIVHAARSVQRRNMGPGYTNIAVMGTYVTLVAAEIYDLADLKQYALKRLDNFRDYTERTGGFSEYNSPTYTMVTLTCLGLLRHDVKDESARKIADDLYRQAWEEMAAHFHPPTRQWAGPHSRCYSTLLKPSVLAVIQEATHGRVDLGQAGAPAYLEAIDVPLPCPREFESMFTTLGEAREVIKTFVKSDNPVIGTTCLHPAFTLGTINRGDMWNQRRSLLAYWGDAKAPAYLHLRLLKNGYDFATGQFFAAQNQGRAIAAINFATDGGDTHISLQRIKDGQFTAKDLRVRFELGGSAAALKPVVPNDLQSAVEFAQPGINVKIVTPFAVFGDSRIRWESGHDDTIAWIDLVLHSGTERAFDLKQTERAVIAVAVQFSANPTGKFPVPTAAEKDGRLDLKWDDLHLNVATKPAKAGQLQAKRK